MFYILLVDIGLKFSVIARYAYFPHGYLYEPLVQNPTIAVTPSVIFWEPMVPIRPSSPALSPQGSNRRLWRGGCNKGKGLAIAYGRRTFTKILYQVIHIDRVYKFTMIIFY